MCDIQYLKLFNSPTPEYPEDGEDGEIKPSGGGTSTFEGSFSIFGPDDHAIDLDLTMSNLDLSKAHRAYE